MPEGDTVWRTARHLDEALSGSVLRESDFRVPVYATLDLSGQPVTQTLARGKHLLTRVGADLTVHTHLRMEGSWHLYRPGTVWRRPGHQARVVLRTDDWTAVGFLLGVVEVIARADEESAVGHLGPDLLGPDWDEQEALARLRDQPRRTIAEALLDQRNLAGIGNLYKSELCFLSGISPWREVAAVSDLARLVRRAQSLLEANKERVAQSTTGDLRRGRQLWVYRRDQRPCRRCGTPIRVTLQGATAPRATYWCPDCQT